MSTFYYLRCERCRELGGFYSRQAWGWGNADIIDTFKCLMAHTECAYTVEERGNASVIVDYGRPDIEIVSEHQVDNDFSEVEEQRWKKHREELDAIFPCSNDWAFYYSFISKKRDQTPTPQEFSKSWREEVEGKE